MAEKLKVDLADMPYPGTPPGWKPDLLWASRPFDAQSIEQQAASAAARWAIDPENPANAGAPSSNGSSAEPGA